MKFPGLPRVEGEQLLGPKYLHHTIYSESPSAAQICLEEWPSGLMVFYPTSWLSRQADLYPWPPTHTYTHPCTFPLSKLLRGSTYRMPTLAGPHDLDSLRYS